MGLYESEWKRKAKDYLEEAKEQNKVREMKEQKYVAITKQNFNKDYANLKKNLPSYGRKQIGNRLVSRHERIGEIGHAASVRTLAGLNGIFRALKRR